MRPTRRLAALFVLACALSAPLAAQTPAVATATRQAAPSRAAAIPTPTEFFGFPMGAERQLAGWDKITEYFALVDRLSDRVVVEELGKTTMGKPYIMAIVSTPEEQLRLTLQALAALGEPVRVADVLGVRTFGYDLQSGGKANLTLELRGTLGTGNLTVVAHGGPGVLQLGQLGTIKLGETEWDFDRRELYLPDSQEHIDLLYLAR